MTNETTTITIEIPAGYAIGNKVAGEWLPVDASKMSNSWALEIFRYGFRKVNDNSKGDMPSERLETARLIVKDMNNGAEFVGRKSGGSSTMTPIARLALSMAKDQLKFVFKSLTGCAKIVDMCQANDKVAAYFDGTTWVDAKVQEWIVAQQAKGVDYVALATKELAERETLAASVDVSDI